MDALILACILSASAFLTLRRLFLLLGVHLVEPYTNRGVPRLVFAGDIFDQTLGGQPQTLGQGDIRIVQPALFLGILHICSLYIATRPPDIQYYIISSNTKRIDYCAPHSTGIPLGCIVLCVRVYQQTGEKRVLLVNFSPISSQVKRLMCFDDNAPTGERP